MTHIFAAIPAALAVFVLAGTAQAGSTPYRTYANRLIAALPGGLVARPDLEARLSALASQARRRSGLKGLAASSKLTAAARAQAADMALGNYIGHHSRRGDRFEVRFAAFAGDWLARRGENAARDRRAGPVNNVKARRLFSQWLKSSGHKRNLMQPWYSHVSTGAVQKGNHLYAVQIFWEKQGRFKRAKPGSPGCMFSRCVSSGSKSKKDWKRDSAVPR